MRGSGSGKTEMRPLPDATLRPHAASGVRLRSASRSSMIRSMNPLVFWSTHWVIAASVAGSLQSLDSARGPKASVICPDKRVQKGHVLMGPSRGRLWSAPTTLGLQPEFERLDFSIPPGWPLSRTSGAFRIQLALRRRQRGVNSG